MHYLVASLIAFLSFVGTLRAQDDAEPDIVVILPSGAIHQGDYFAAGDSIEISGTVNGDVYAIGEQVFIDGHVHGDVLVAGGSVHVAGNVDHNVRVIAGQTTLSGSIGQNATVIAGSADLVASCQIAGNLVCMAGNIDSAARSGNNVTLVASNARLSSKIGNNLQAYVGNLRLTSKAQINGDVEYSSSTLARIEEGAVIRGKILHHPSLLHDLLKGSWIKGFLIGSKVAAILMNVLYTFVIGWILIKLFPYNLDAALNSFGKTPFKALAYGGMFIVLIPLISLLLLMTILGAPFALTLIALNVIGFYTAKIYSIIWASEAIFKRLGVKMSQLGMFSCGLVLYFSLTALPFFGTALAFAALLFGLGAGLLAQTTRRPFLRKN